LQSAKESIVTASIHPIWLVCVVVAALGFSLVAMLIGVSNFLWRKSLRDRMAGFREMRSPRIRRSSEME
jgi:hypothetical protein